MIRKTYPYKPRKLIFLFCFVFFAGCAVAFTMATLSSDGPLKLVILRHIIEFNFSALGAKIFYGSLAAISALMSLAGLWGLIKSSLVKQCVILDEDKITVPSGLFSLSDHVDIAYTDIKDLVLFDTNKARGIKIIHSQGKHTIADVCLPEKNALDHIIEELTDEVKKSRL